MHISGMMRMAGLLSGSLCSHNYARKLSSQDLDCRTDPVLRLMALALSQLEIVSGGTFRSNEEE